MEPPIPQRLRIRINMYVVFSMVIIHIVPSYATCSLGEHQCNDGICIQPDDICDGHPDCVDSSDETEALCSKLPCAISGNGGFDGSLAIGAEYRCAYGGCISSYFLCNGIRNCVDGSDETATACRSKKCSRREFRCAYGGCVRSLRVCDNRRSCDDGSDETIDACVKKRRICNSQQFKCSYGSCISMIKRCDRKVDCLDGSDETFELCGYSLIVPTPVTETTTISTTPTTTTSTTTPRTTTTSTTPTTTTSTTTTIHRIVDPCEDSPCGLYSICVDTVGRAVCECMPGYLGEPPKCHPECITNGYCPQHFVCVNTKCIDPCLQYCGIRATCKVVNRLPHCECPDGYNGNPMIRCYINPIPMSGHGSLTGTGLTFPDYGQNNTAIFRTCGVGECGCPPPREHICIPCEDSGNINDTCRVIGDTGVCSKMATAGVDVEILSCGVENLFFLGHLERNGQETFPCGTENGVPVLTVALVDCWDSTSYILRCHADGRWHTYYPSTEKDKTSMVNLCQPTQVNSAICGKRPRFEKTQITYEYEKITKQVPQWPWLVGLLRRHKYSCTATIITPRHLLTAGHCVLSSQETSSETIDPRHLYIQYLSHMNTIEETWVASIRLNPLYRAGRRPGNDLAIIILEQPILFSKHVFPACLDDVGIADLHDGTTFLRSEGDEDYKWTLVTQNFDYTCFYPSDRCSDELRIGPNQFCGINKKTGLLLQPGSSGGPYLVNGGGDVNEAWSISGIVSYSVNRASSCRQPYTVFSSVVKQLCWITQCITNDVCKTCE